MGAVERSWSDWEADRFFAGFVNATPELIAAIETERGGDLAAVVAEEKAFGYWDRKMAARAQRRAERDRAEAVERAARLEASAVTRGPDEGARLAPLAEQSALMLPEARFVLLTDAEYNDTRRWWHRLQNPTTARSLARKIQAEIRDADRNARRAAREAAVWREGERAFERAQWRAVVANRNTRPARRIANQWVAIDEDRALAIALAALEQGTPPQPRN